MTRVLSVMLVLLAGGTAHSADPPKKLNVLFLMSDDMRPELGCYGHTIVQSPNIDALAKAGVRFDRAYCQYPLCNPSRTSLLTGRHPITTGVLDNTVYFRDAHPDWVTLPEHFRSNGYATLRTGKIFHGGIDDVQSWTEGAEARKKPGEAKKLDPKERQKQSDRIVVLEGDGQSHGDYRSADRAIQFLRQYKDQPFFLACGFTKPHSPPTAPKKFFDLYDAAKIPLPKTFTARPAAPAGFPERSITPNGDLFIGRDASEEEAKKMLQAYYASTSWTDWNVGRVVAELGKLGLRGNTVIVFWGDHGYHLGEFGKWAKHGSLFETGTRVPLVVVPPGSKMGAVVQSPVQTLDIYPTLCELCGLKPPAGIEGHSLKPLLDDANARWDHPAYSVSGNSKNLGVAVRTAKYRYAEWSGPKGGGAMLIDETADPHETKNLINDPKLAVVRDELAALAKRHTTGGSK
jgi:arylsulfatase A-like enzyme